MRALAFVSILAITVAGCSSDQGPAPGAESADTGTDDGSPRCPGVAVWHRAGAEALDMPAGARGCHAYTGRPALEPTIGVTGDGSLYFQVFAPENVVDDRVKVLRSTDRAVTWDDVTPRLGQTGVDRHPSSGDPVLWVDRDTGRVFTGDFIPPCHEVSWSDDAGLSWTTSVASCDIIDHQTMFTGPPTTSQPSGYDNIVYYCGPAGLDTRCVKSIDGGISWIPTRSLAYPPQPGGGEVGGLACNGGGHGHGQAGPDGTIYLAKANYCGQPWLAMSDDEGASWTRAQVADNGSPWHEAEADEDDDGNLHYTWIGGDRLPYYGVSTDQGATWSEPMMVGPPGIQEASQPGLAYGNGTVAITYLGRLDPAAANCGGPCPAGAFENGTWHGFTTLVRNGTSDDPWFLTVSAHDPRDPIVTGECGQSRCQSTGDFHDVVVDNQGRAWTAFADQCFEDSCDHQSHAGSTFARGLVTWVGGT